MPGCARALSRHCSYGVPGRADELIDYFVGLRWWDNDLDVTIVPAVFPGTVTTKINEDWIDLVIGMRWTNPINEKWSFMLHGDIGGLGSDFTTAVIAGFRYKLKESMQLDLQYKADVGGL